MIFYFFFYSYTLAFHAVEEGSVSVIYITLFMGYNMFSVKLIFFLLQLTAYNSWEILKELPPPPHTQRVHKQ